MGYFYGGVVQKLVSVLPVEPVFLQCRSKFDQLSPTKSSINDGSFDGNYWGGREYLSAIQWLTVPFDPTHSYHLINGLRFSLEFEVGQRDQIVTCDRADSPLIPNDRVPNGYITNFLP